MKSLKAKFRKSDAHEWNKNDERLLAAVEHGEVDKVASLLSKKGTSAVKLDGEGKTALHVAAMRGQIEVLSAILSHGADLTVTDAAGFTALHLAAKNNHAECAKRLIQSKCPLDVVDSSGKTALHHAAASGNGQIVQLLCEHKSPVNLRDAEGFTPLLLSARHAHAEACGALLDWGADVTSTDNSGRTALMLASQHSSASVAELLLNRGADLYAVDSQGHDASNYAALSGSAEVTAEVTAVLTSALCKQQDKDTKSPKPIMHDIVAKLNDERITTPKKRKAPPPPISPPLQNSGQSSPSYIIPTGTPMSSKSDSNKKVNCTEQEATGATLGGEVTELQEERRMLLETIEDLRQVLEQGAGHEQTELTGGQASALVSSLQAKISVLTLENQQLSSLVKKQPSRQGGEDPRETSRPSSTASNSSFHSTRDNFEVPPQDLPSPGPVPGGNGAGARPAASLRRVEGEEEGEEGRGGGSQEEIRLLRQALDSVQAKLLQTRKENRSLQAQLRPPPAGRGREQGEEGKMEEEKEEERGRERDEEEEEEERGREREGELLESLAELQAKLTETQERYHQALEEVEGLRAQAGRTPGAVGGGASLDQEVAQLRGLVAEAGAERERAARRTHQLEEALDKAKEERDDAKGRQEEERRKLVQMEELYKAAQEEVAMLQEALSGTVSVEAAAKDFEEMKAEHSQAISGLQRRLMELSHSYSETKSQLGAAQRQLAEAQANLPTASSELQGLKVKVEELQASLAEAEAKHSASQQEVTVLRREAKEQAQGSVALSDHTQVVLSLGNAIKELECQSEALKQQLSQKTLEVDALQDRLAEERRDDSSSSPRDSVPRPEYESLREGLESEAARLTQLLQGALRKQDEVALEAAAAWQEVRESRAEREALQELVMSREKETHSLAAKLCESQDAVGQLKQLVENHVSSEREKNKRIDDLSREVGKLKDALNSLSQMSYTSGSASKRQQHQQHQQQQQLEALQQQSKQLQYQLAESKKQHHEIVSVYRMHLLYAVQGQMDEDVQKALKQILMMCKVPSQAKETCRD